MPLLDTFSQHSTPHARWLSVNSGLHLEAQGWGAVGTRAGAWSLLVQVAAEVLVTLVAESHPFPLPFPGLPLNVLAKGILKEGKQRSVFSITRSICKNNIKIMSMKER